MTELIVAIAVVSLIWPALTIQATDTMNTVAERYAHLVLAPGQHDPDYVDAFYGPVEWKTLAEKEKKSLDAIGAEAAELIATLTKIPDAATTGDEMLKLRREYLQKQISRVTRGSSQHLTFERMKLDRRKRIETGSTIAEMSAAR